jgi:hypothetical protein
MDYDDLDACPITKAALENLSSDSEGPRTRLYRAVIGEEALRYEHASEFDEDRVDLDWSSKDADGNKTVDFPEDVTSFTRKSKSSSSLLLSCSSGAAQWHRLLPLLASMSASLLTLFSWYSPNGPLVA